MDAHLSSNELSSAVRGGRPPLIIDVRRKPVFRAAADMIAGALWRDPERVADWAGELPRASHVVAYCVHGHEVSQGVAKALAGRGLSAQYLQGGIEEGWKAAGGALDAKPGGANTRWVTRERPKIDRIACPWLVARFVDPGAEFLYVPAKEVLAAAKERAATPYDVPDVYFSHEGERCSFDAFLKHYRLTDPALGQLALIVRGADTARRDLARALAQLRRRPRDAKSRHGDLRRALRVVQIRAGRGSHLEPRGVPLNEDRTMSKALTLFISTFASVAAMTTTHAETFSFDRDATGALPAGWRAGVTGRGAPKWSVEADATAPSKPDVLKQSVSGFFPWAAGPEVSLENRDVEVTFKPLTGREDQAGGVVWRWKDGDNYYVARANALENNVSLYYTTNGRRNTIKYVDAPVPRNVWHTLRVEFSGKKIRVILDGKQYIETDDDHIVGSGAVGLWTKADSVTLFDDFSYGAAPAR